MAVLLSRVFLHTTIILFTTLCWSTSFATSPSQAASELSKEWAQAKYQTSGKKQQIQKLESLIEKAESYSTAYPDDAEILLWHGTILSTYGSIHGGLSSLKYVAQAKDLLHKSIRLNPHIEKGLAHAVLGGLYARVPGRPVGFGDPQKAAYHLRTALSIDPRGIDPNYYYGDFLVHEGEYEEAQYHLRIAQRTPIRQNQWNVADKGRKVEVALSVHKLPPSMR